MGGLAAFILLSIFSVAESLKGPKRITLTEAALGDNVTLTCNISGHDKGLFYWHKLSYGYMEQIVTQSTLGSVEIEDVPLESKFLVTKEHNVYSLIIKHVNMEDEAMYFCQTGSAYKLEFVNGTHLAVIGSQTMTSVFVNQSSAMASVPLGTTVTLQCSLYSERKEKSDLCEDERTVLWFKAGPKSDSGLIYMNKINCAERRCTYHLSKTIQNSLDTGIYYCAVLTCGHILFGEGTKVETRPGVCPFVIVLGALLGCSVLLNFTLILIRRKLKWVSDEGKPPSSHGEPCGSAEDQMTNLDGEEDGENYVALNFLTRKPTGWKTRRETSEESTYSNIKLSLKGSVHGK